MRAPGIRRRAALAVTAAAAALSLGLSGCAGGTGDTNTAATAPVKLSDTGKELDRVTVAFPGSLSNLYIGQENGILNYNLVATVQEGLVRHDSSGKIVPALAKSWTQPDPTTYVFELRENAKFQNGDPVTPQDVVFSIEKAQDPESSPGINFYLTGIASATVTGEHEVTVKTTQPDATLLTNLSNAGALVVTQQKFWEDNGGKVGTSKALLLGTGPYKVTEFKPDSHVTLERVNTWWGGTPKVKQIRINFIPDANTRLAAAKKGDIDIAFNVPINQVEQWQKLPDTRVEAINDLSYAGLLFDQNVKPFNKLEVRKAIAQAVPRTEIAEKLLQGYGQLATAITTPESLAGAYNAKEASKILAEIKQPSYNLENAKKLIKDAGATGTKVELVYPNTGPQLGIAAQAIAENLKQIGLQGSVREVPIEEWLAAIGDGKHGVSFMWYFSTTGDPSEVNSYLVGPDNPNHFESTEAADIVAAATGITDSPKQRIKKLLELEKLSAENVVNLPLWWGKSVTSFSNKVGLKDYGPYSFNGPWGAELFAAKVK